MDVDAGVGVADGGGGGGAEGEGLVEPGVVAEVEAVLGVVGDGEGEAVGEGHGAGDGDPEDGVTSTPSSTHLPRPFGYFTFLSLRVFSHPLGLSDQQPFFSATSPNGTV